MESARNVLTLSHEIYYSNKNEIPIREVVESLLALERIIKRTPAVLSALTEISIDGVEVYVDELQSGSLFEKIAINLFFKDEADLDAFLAKIREKLGEHKVARNVLIGAIIASLLGTGLFYAAKSMNPQGVPSIQANNNIILNIGADEARLPRESLQAIIEAAVGPYKKELARDAVKVIKPAQSDTSARIVMDGNEMLVMTPEVIKATPPKVDMDDLVSTKEYKDVDLQIRATNLDSATQGWAGLIPGLIDRRIRLELADGVDRRDIAGHFQIRADVTIHYRMDKKAKQQAPKLIVVQAVIKD